ncbi:MAG: GDSL-type esterase/lipase family protein [Bacteroidales bacterium]|nr:GDSL-type esterase/lipase family protein [Bacteroidales bacterium]
MEELKEKIKQLIAPNGKNAITAQVLQSVLLEIVDELKAECGSLGTSVDELETNDKNQDERLKTLFDDMKALEGERVLIAERLSDVELSDRDQDETIDAIIDNINKLESSDTAIVRRLQGQGDSITANTSAIEDLNSQIGDIEVKEVGNLIDVRNIIRGRYFSNDGQGNPIYKENKGYCTSCPIKLKKGNYILYNAAVAMEESYVKAAICSEDGEILLNVVECTEIGEDLYEFSLTEDRFIIVNLGSVSAKLAADNLVLHFLTKKENWDGILKPYIITDIANFVNKENDIVDNLNLFEGKGEYGHVSAGELKESSTHLNSGLMPIKAFTNYKFIGNKNVYGSTAISCLVYDANKKIFSGLSANEEADGFYTVVSPIDGYIRVNVGKNLVDKFVFCKESLFTSAYSKPQKILNREIKVNTAQLEGEIGNPLYGKIISFNGDSISATQGGYGKIIAERNKMIYENISVGGGVITNGLTTSGGISRHCISSSVLEQREDADFIILEGGVNDASLSVEMGSITKGYTVSLDDTTFLGACESMCKNLISRFKGKKIGFVMVHKMTANFNSNGDKETNYYWKLKEVLEKWGIPFVDLNTLCPPIGYIQELKDLYTTNSDGWHPNEEGYKLFYCDKIEAWLKTL